MAEREIIEAQATELEHREKERGAENAKLKKAGNKILVLEAESSELQAEKEAIEDDLDKNIDDTLTMLSQCIFQVVCQAHVLYNGPPSSDEFEPNMDVFEGRILPSNKVQALQSATQPAPTEGAEDEEQ